MLKTMWILGLKGLSITFMSNGKHKFVSRDQVPPPKLVVYCSLFLHIN